MFTQPRKRLAAVAGAIALAGAAGAIGILHGPGGTPLAEARAAGASAAIDVDAAVVISRGITDWQSYTGRLEAVDQVEVRPLVSGTIVAVHFRDGALVHKGDPLFTIDPRPYQAAVDRTAAQLAAALARAAYTSADAARAERLIGDNAIARRDYDEKQNAAREAAAGVKAAQAALEAARVDLGYTRIVAPVAGRVSRAELTPGNTVSAGANAPLLTTLVSVSPIYASFEVDEQTYLQYLGHDRDARVPVALGLADENGYSRDGVIASVDNRLDTGSGTVRVRASFANADGALVPGLYARVKVGGGRAHDAILVDDAAIGTDQSRKYVLVVDASNRIRYRTVQPGGLHDGLREIEAGLAPGERIVVNGTLRVRPNDLVHARMVGMADAAKQPA
ncbi:efflux RND transporter periplasmic adaptor subunit [Burkholderia gladioli]|uniref:efflux RND transporter periplasmic adaptor subunit n=1 Tax=Burkholderia gladioli TaxID=28095 RepID=UPI0013649456|nr:efflux RND transporter periplasmic adaptor subunit [Burkholderia gladioli]KAF1059201.1 Multidrug resistance protein MdtE [Burkholderia gladioli]WAG23318.1 efflux RND transporter periplasmic adaptor subunit [Burkholderia gladioli]